MWYIVHATPPPPESSSSTSDFRMVTAVIGGAGVWCGYLGGRRRNSSPLECRRCQFSVVVISPSLRKGARRQLTSRVWRSLRLAAGNREPNERRRRRKSRQQQQRRRASNMNVSQAAAAAWNYTHDDEGKRGQRCPKNNSYLHVTGPPEPQPWS